LDCTGLHPLPETRKLETGCRELSLVFVSHSRGHSHRSNPLRRGQTGPPLVFGFVLPNLSLWLYQRSAQSSQPCPRADDCPESRPERPGRKPALCRQPCPDSSAPLDDNSELTRTNPHRSAHPAWSESYRAAGLARLASDQKKARRGLPPGRNSRISISQLLRFAIRVKNLVNPPRPA
jgi:hypothetical protein